MDPFAAHALEVAPRLLGARLTANGVSVRLTEVEAYGGAGEDPASHAFRGPGKRNSTMFGPPGRLYVYFTYGMHWCANVVCSPDGEASAVLLRAGEIVDGLELARSRRMNARSDAQLASGPARLAVALALTGMDDGAVLLAGRTTRDDGPALLPAGRTTRDDGPALLPAGRSATHDDDAAPLVAAPPADPASPDPAAPRRSGAFSLELPSTPCSAFRTGPRTGVSGPGGEAAAFPWRFWIPGDPTVSPYRPHHPKRPPAVG